MRFLSIFACVSVFLSFLIPSHTQHSFFFFVLSYFSLLIFNSHIFNHHLERLCLGPLLSNKLISGLSVEGLVVKPITWAMFDFPNITPHVHAKYILWTAYHVDDNNNIDIMWVTCDLGCGTFPTCSTVKYKVQSIRSGWIWVVHRWCSFVWAFLNAHVRYLSSTNWYFLKTISFSNFYVMDVAGVNPNRS